jgi:hypothetical protein
MDSGKRSRLIAEQKKHPNVYVSLSTAINGRSSNYKSLIAVCANDRILAESDYDDILMSTQQTWNIVKSIAEVKNWKVETTWVEDLEEKDWGVVHHLKRNWERFREGNHVPSRRKAAGIGRKSHPIQGNLITDTNEFNVLYK